MESNRKRTKAAGFTLVEIMLSMIVLGFVLISVAGVFLLFQKGAAQTTEYAEVQQNARVALDLITSGLRQAGSQTDYFHGQRPIVHAGPFQVALNADIDNGRTIDGLGPLDAINRALMPNRVPAGGTAIYIPAADYDSPAETVVFTLDSNDDGVIGSGDRGDDPEEKNNANRNLFVLKRMVYGDNRAGSNEVRESNVALVRGPNLSPTWTIPQPLFKYWYDHDENEATPDLLWGDSDGSGELEPAECLAVGAMPNALLSRIRRIQVTAMSESDTYDKKYETNGGFLDVTMTSEVAIRNVSLASAQIRGRVYHDVDKDGVIDAGETGIPGVEIRLAGQNRTAITDNAGMFYFPLPAGDYSLQEVDPPGYLSSTSNLVSLTLTSGGTKVVNFGDYSIAPSGVIMGTVYADANMDGIKGMSEAGLPGVLISLDSGEEVQTNSAGRYSFIATQGNYIVVETDPSGYTSTTPNSVGAAIVAQGDTVVIDFGDYAGEVYGTLEGYVFLDDNLDGVRSTGEEGLPNATIRVSSGDSTKTNASGYYRFNLTPGTYSVTEADPVGYTSTTVNTYVDIPITADTTVVRHFGDMLDTQQNFVEIHISNTERVLSVTTADLNEDDKNDVDIVLGTALLSEYGNMLVFQNKWESNTTPVSELFDPDPTYRREAGNNINAMTRYDFTGDGTPDVMTGLDVSTMPNLQVWFVQTGGLLSVSPDRSYQSSGLNEVLDMRLADFDRDGRADLLVGLKSSVGTTGAFETLRGDGAGGFSHWEYHDRAGPAGEIVLAQVWAVDAADLDGDGDLDVIVGTHQTAYTGHIDLYENTGYATGVFAWRARYQTHGAVNDIVAIDMMEDDARDPDILVGTSYAANTGRVLLYLNTNGTLGVADTTGYAFGPYTTPRWPDDYVEAGGEVLSLGTLRLNNDIFPDVTYGTRSSSLYTGDLFVLPAYGTLPVAGTKINTSSPGEIVTIGVADFNKDGRPDIVVGTRSSASQGRLIAYFGREL